MKFAKLLMISGCIYEHSDVWRYQADVRPRIYWTTVLYIGWQWIHLLFTRYGQCCRRHIVGQRIVSDISVVRSCWNICSLCFESNNTNLLLRLLTDIRGTSILLHTANITWPTTWRRIMLLVTIYRECSDATLPYVYCTCTKAQTAYSLTYYQQLNPCGSGL